LRLAAENLRGRGGELKSRAKNPDPVSVIEEAYRFGGSDEAWLRGIAQAAQPPADARAPS
jgi:hypothetical protein